MLLVFRNLRMSNYQNMPLGSSFSFVIEQEHVRDDCLALGISAALASERGISRCCASDCTACISLIGARLHERHTTGRPPLGTRVELQLDLIGSNKEGNQRGAGFTQ